MSGAGTYICPVCSAPFVTRGVTVELHIEGSTSRGVPCLRSVRQVYCAPPCVAAAFKVIAQQVEGWELVEPPKPPSQERS